MDRRPIGVLCFGPFLRYQRLIEPVQVTDEARGWLVRWGLLAREDLTKRVSDLSVGQQRKIELGILVGSTPTLLSSTNPPTTYHSTSSNPCDTPSPNSKAQLSRLHTTGGSSASSHGHSGPFTKEICTSPTALRHRIPRSPYAHTALRFGASDTPRPSCC